MYKAKRINFFLSVISVSLLLYGSASIAQKSVASDAQAAGFRFDGLAASAQPIIQYQQNIALLSGIDDRQSFRVYGDGRVLVHNPDYMKRAGDYVMQLDDAELIELIRNLSANGVTDFDEQKVKDKVRADENRLRAQGQYHEISDSHEVVIDIRLDEYQQDKSAKLIKNFSKQFRWKNLEHDAVRHHSNAAITRANSAVQKLRALMDDRRLVKQQR